MKDRYRRLRMIIIAMGLACLFLSGYLFLSDKKKTDYDEAVSASTDTGTKRVALTFDDGPHGRYTPMLLDGLEARNVKATFFLVGEQADKYPDIVKRISEAGHLIGNHTYHHANLGKASDALIMEEIVSANKLLEEITGQAPAFVRPPYGADKDRVEKLTGLSCVLWNVDPMDWNTTDADAVVEHVLEHVKDDSIILLHDRYDSSVMGAFGIIDALKSRGYRFVTVDEILKDWE